MSDRDAIRAYTKSLIMAQISGNAALVAEYRAIIAELSNATFVSEVTNV